MERNLADLFPIWGIEHDCILSRQGDLTLAFEVMLPEIFTLSNEDYESLHHAWIKAVRLLPAGSVFHKQDWFTESRYIADFSKEGQCFLARGSERFFNERPFLDHHCLLYLTQRPAGRKPASSALSSLFRRSIVPGGL